MSQKRYMYKIGIYLQWKTNRKSYMACQMAPMAVSLNVLEVHSPLAWLFKCNSPSIWAVFYNISANSVLVRSLGDGWVSCFQKSFGSMCRSVWMRQWWLWCQWDFEIHCDMVIMWQCDKWCNNTFAIFQHFVICILYCWQICAVHYSTLYPDIQRPLRWRQWW